MREGELRTFAVIGFIVFVIGGIIAVPVFLIWSLNTLFGLAIPYTFKTWVACAFLFEVLVLLAFIGSPNKTKGN
jgi:hypothetical protein